MLLRGERVSFAEWLEVSWFYPEGFRKEQIIETTRSWIVLGAQIVYKFLKVSEHAQADATSREFFAERWKAACEEVNDHRALAPDLYLGLRLLRWVDDEPVWISERPNDELDPFHPPLSADDVAIVMRRIPQGQMLHKALRDQSISESEVRIIAPQLKRFHSTAPLLGDSIRQHVQLLRGVEENYLTSLNDFMLSHSGFLDPFSQLAFGEVSCFLNSFYRMHEESFFARAEQKAFCDCHGSLRADRICRLTAMDKPSWNVFNRLPQEQTGRFADWLSDVAALSVDLEARGFAEAAAAFERAYFRGIEPDAILPEMYRFYKIGEAARRAQILLRGNVDDGSVQGTSYLSLAFRYALNLHGAFFVIIGGTAPEAESALGKSIAELIPCKVLEVECLPEAWNSLRLADELMLDQLLLMARAEIADEQPVVLLWPLNREEERIRLIRFAGELEVPVLLVQCENNTREPAISGGRRILSNNGSRYTLVDTRFAPQMIVEPVLAPAIQALEVLKQLRREYQPKN